MPRIAEVRRGWSCCLTLEIQKQWMDLGTCVARQQTNRLCAVSSTEGRSNENESPAQLDLAGEMRK
jgi:hypothetical protein